MHGVDALVCLFDVPVTAKHDLDQLNNFLSEEDQEKAARVKHPGARVDYLYSHALLRLQLQQFVGRPARKIEFSYGKFGKPMLSALENCPNIHFNISHSNGSIATILSKRNDVGIDIEQANSEIPSGVMEKVFTDNERQLVENLPTNKRSALFWKIWTLKEAYVKSLGLGLNVDLAKVQVVSGCHGNPTVAFMQDGHKTSLFHFRETEKSVSAAVKTIKEITPSIIVKRLPLNDFYRFTSLNDDPLRFWTCRGLMPLL